MKVEDCSQRVKIDLNYAEAARLLVFLEANSEDECRLVENLIDKLDEYCNT